MMSRQSHGHLKPKLCREEPSALDLFGASPSPAPLLPEDRHGSPAVQQAPERRKKARAQND